MLERINFTQELRRSGIKGRRHLFLIINGLCNEACNKLFRPPPNGTDSTKSVARKH